MKVFKCANDGESAFGAAWQEGDVLGLACDMVDKKMSFSVNGTFEPSLGVAFDNIVVVDNIVVDYAPHFFLSVSYFSNMKDVFKFDVLVFP